MPERRRDYDGTPPEVKYGLLSQADYDALRAALNTNDLNAFARLAVPLCEDSVPLFAVLFLRKHATPHIWKEWKRIQRYPRILVRLPRGHTKALAMDTPVPTPTGWTTMGDLKTGDMVLDEAGRPTKVWSAEPVMHDRPCYRVTFNDGSSIVTDEDHWWATRTKEERSPRKMVGGKRIRLPSAPAKVRTTTQIRDTLLVPRKGKWKEYNHSVDVAAPWELPERPLPVDPYVLGAWLGDGSSTAARITSADEEVIEYIRAAGHRVRKGKEDFDWAINDGARSGPKKDCLQKSLRDLGLLGNKHIPDDYLLASAAQRMALLQGLMDTDGTCNSSGQCSFTNTNEVLSRQVYRLAASLGLIPHFYESQPAIKGRPEAVCQKAFHISFITKTPVFRLTRKLQRQAETTERAYTGATRTIVAVERVPSVPVRCILVETPSGLFLAGDNSVPTHNTDLFTFCALVHRICYNTVPGSKHEDPRVVAIFETRPRANDRMLSIRQVFETGGPGGLIGAVFRGAMTFAGGEPTPWAGMTIPEIARKFGEWNNQRINLPHPRRLAKPDPSVTSLSPGEGSVGFHPRLVIADDIVGPKTASSDLRRHTLANWWNSAIEQVIKPYTVVWIPHTVYHEDDLNNELAKLGTYYLMEMKALDRFPDKEDFTEIRDDQNVLIGIELTSKGESLVPLWGCPEYSESECPAFDGAHTDPAMGGIMHRPVKDLIFQWLKKPMFFASQYMHVIRRTDDASVKPWMLRFYCPEPNHPCVGQVSHWHKEWDDWREEYPDAGLARYAPKMVLFTSEGVVEQAKGAVVSPIERAVHGWDLAFGHLRTNDRTVCARMYRTMDKRYFTVFDKGRWKHDQVWRKIVLNAVTDAVKKPDEVALEVDAENIYPQEVSKLMRSMNVADRFKLTEIRRTKDKDTVFQNSGLPVTMINGYCYVDVHDQDAVLELLSVTADQSGGHDDCLDAMVNGYGRIRSINRMTPGFFGTPL